MNNVSFLSVVHQKRKIGRIQMKPIIVTDENFTQEVLNSNIPVLVDFWAPWCAPCQTIAPVLEEIAMEMAGQVKVVKINTDQNSIPMQYQIRSIPTMIIFKDGRPVDQIIGAVPKTIVMDKLNYYSFSPSILN
jgi:thioredoxin 1